MFSNGIHEINKISNLKLKKTVEKYFLKKLTP